MPPFVSPCLTPSSIPSLETRNCSVLLCLVAAKTEGDEMGQYVMALYQNLILHLRRPYYCWVMLFEERILAEMLHGASGLRRCSSRELLGALGLRRIVALGSERQPFVWLARAIEERASLIISCMHPRPSTSATHCISTCSIGQEAGKPLIALRTCAVMHLEPRLAKTPASPKTAIHGYRTAPSCVAVTSIQ